MSRTICMDSLTGNTIIFTDLHAGLSNNKVSRLNICVKVIKEILASVKKNNVENILFCGDWFHSRTLLDLNTINISLKLVSALAKACNVYLIVGNHDAYLKNSTDVNSLNIFRENPNVHVINDATEIQLNGQRCLLVPWLTDMTKFSKGTFDLMAGHFEISSKYLIQSYIEDQTKKAQASSSASAKIESDSMLASSAKAEKSADLLGEFVDVVKDGGIIYAGHIHTHKESIVRRKKFIFVGAPYQQNLGDIDGERGYYLLDQNNTQKFIEIESVPKHIQVPMSSAIAGKFDFSAVAGNIVQKVYDIEVKHADDIVVTQKITDFKPYEELLPDYQVKLDFSSMGSTTASESIALIKKSKLDYMKNYIDNIDHDALADQQLDRDKLFSVLEMYYNKVTGGEQSR